MWKSRTNINRTVRAAPALGLQAYSSNSGVGRLGMILTSRTPWWGGGREPPGTHSECRTGAVEMHPSSVADGMRQPCRRVWVFGHERARTRSGDGAERQPLRTRAKMAAECDTKSCLECPRKREAAGQHNSSAAQIDREPTQTAERTCRARTPSSRSSSSNAIS